MTAIRLTPAQRRALGKACANAAAQGVRRSERPLDAIQDPAWDNPHVIDRLVAKKLLSPGEAFNTFIPTPLGLGRYEGRRSRQNRSEA